MKKLLLAFALTLSLASATLAGEFPFPPPCGCAPETATIAPEESDLFTVYVLSFVSKFF